MYFQASPEGALSKANPEYTSTPAGYGPRHMAIHEDLKIAYVIFELESYIGIYNIQGDQYGWAQILKTYCGFVFGARHFFPIIFMQAFGI